MAQANLTVSAPGAVEEREACLTVSTGFQGGGKSYQTLHTIARYIQLHPDRKALIYDVNREYVKENCLKHGLDIDIKKLAPTVQDILRFAAHKTERVRRIEPVDLKTGREMDLKGKKDLLTIILNNFRSGLLLIEDMNKYLTNVRHIEEILSILVSLRHVDLDVIVHFQTLSKLDTTMWENAKFIRMHWQSDNVDRYRNRIPNYPLIKIAQQLVNYMVEEGKNPRFFVWIHNQQNKLSGNFSKQDFYRAFYRYLKINQSELKEAYRVMGFNPKDMNEQKKAVDHCFRKFETMYGNAW